MLPDHRVRPADPPNALIVTEDLTNKVVAWATEISRYAAQLPSKQARDDYLRERRRELVTGAQAEGATPRDAAIVADACVDAARRIMTELLALRAGAPQGRAVAISPNQSRHSGFRLLAERFSALAPSSPSRCRAC